MSASFFFVSAVNLLIVFVRPVSHRVSRELPPTAFRTSCLPPPFARAASHRVSHELPTTLPIHPATLRFVVSVAWRGRKVYCPSDLPLRSIPPTALRLWAPPAYGRGWPGSSGQHRLRPMHKSTVAIPCLPARSTHKPFAPLPLTSLAGTTNLSSCMGLSTIIRHGAIYHRAVWDHRLSHG